MGIKPLERPKNVGCWRWNGKSWNHRPWWKVAINSVLRFFQQGKNPKLVLASITEGGNRLNPPHVTGYTFCYVPHNADHDVHTQRYAGVDAGNVNMDGLRLKLAREFNSLVTMQLWEDMNNIEYNAWLDMRNTLVVLLLTYDDRIEEDLNDVFEDSALFVIPNK